MKSIISTLHDKYSIAEVVATERMARDTAQWDVMKDQYADDSLVDISWFYGRGIDFVSESKLQYEGGARSSHQLGPTLVSLNADKGLAETGCTIILLGALEAVSVQVVSYSRLYERLVRTSSGWKLAGLRVVYQSDRLFTFNPAENVGIDATKMATFRASYRAMAYLQAANGQRPRADLPGIDHPDSVAKLLFDEKAWLEGKV